MIVFSAYRAEPWLPASLAQADGLLAKDVGARELFHSIRAVYGGERPCRRSRPPCSRRRSNASTRTTTPSLELLDGTADTDVAETLRVERRDVRHAVHRIVHTLRSTPPAQAPEADPVRRLTGLAGLEPALKLR